MDQTSFRGKTAVVTGGSGGIGSGICRVLAQAGGQLVVVGHSSHDKIQAVVSSLPGGPHMGARVSVEDSAGLEKLAEDIKFDINTSAIPTEPSIPPIKVLSNRYGFGLAPGSAGA